MLGAVEDAGICLEELPFPTGGEAFDEEGPVAETEWRRAIGYPCGSLPEECPECGGRLAAEPTSFILVGRKGNPVVLDGPGDFCTDCGATVFCSDCMREMFESAAPHEREYLLFGCVRSTDGDRYGLDCDDEIIRLAVFEGTEWVGGAKKRLDLFASRKSRNGPCSCGSGKKYKRCCGRQRRAS